MIHYRLPRTLSLLMLIGLLLRPAAATAQGRSLDLAVRGYGLSFGDSEVFTGLRFNYRDRFLERMNGINVTLWRPYDNVGSTVNVLALGVVATGAGLTIGLLNYARHLKGLQLGLLNYAGNNPRGLRWSTHTSSKGSGRFCGRLVTMLKN